LLLNLQISSAEDTPCPASELVELALEKWAQCRVKADNISVVVVLFEHCKSLDSSAVIYNCSFEEDGLALGHYSMSSTLDTLIRNPVSIGSINSQLYKSHHSKKSHAQKPLTLVNKMQSGKSGSVKRQKHKFKIPTTPEQRSAYWSHRKRSKMIENLPLDFNFFADVNLHRPAVERF